MISLFLDTSTKNVTLALIKDNDILYLFHEKVEENLSVKLLGMIDNTLKECNLSIKEINRIYVSNGPGSFTGIRIGLTIIKVIAWSLKIDVIPFSSLELMATTNTNSNYVIPLIDARRGNYFCAVYDNKLNIIKKDSFTTLDEITKDVDNYSLVSYGDVENTKEVNIDIIKVIDKHKNDVPINPHMLNPNYLKMTEAEENLRKNDN